MSMLVGYCGRLFRDVQAYLGAPAGPDAEAVGTLVHETLTDAALIAVAASGLNAAARGYAGEALACAGHLLPRAPVLSSQLLSADHPRREVASAATALGAMYDASETLRREAGMPLADVARDRQRQIIERQKSLQDLCGISLSALPHVEALAASVNVPPDLRLPNVALILKSARDGGLPCLDSSGRLVVPEWLQRRARQRWPVRFTVDVVSARSADVATALDISVSGMGIACFGSFRKDDAVTLRVPDGRMIEGIVVWRHFRRCGVRFNQELDASDPLLGEAYRVLDRRGPPLK